MSALVKTESTGLAREQDNLSREQIDLIKKTIAAGSTDAELQLFVQTCNRLRMDPFAKQIYLVKRGHGDKAKADIQVSIDGFRLVAERTRGYRGQTAPMWCGADGVWVDVWLHDEAPKAAKCGVYREGFAEPLVRVATFASYVQTAKDKDTGEWGPTKMWRNMPDVMLAKCAEALALRAAFPHDLSGLYTPEEMGQVSRAEGVIVAELEPTTRGANQDGPTPAEAIGMLVDIDLPKCLTHEHLVDWARVLNGIHAPRPGAKDPAWKAWATKCADLELVPSELAAEARRPL